MKRPGHKLILIEKSPFEADLNRKDFWKTETWKNKHLIEYIHSFLYIYPLDNLNWHFNNKRFNYSRLYEFSTFRENFRKIQICWVKNFNIWASTLFKVVYEKNGWFWKMTEKTQNDTDSHRVHAEQLEGRSIRSNRTSVVSRVGWVLVIRHQRRWKSLSITHYFKNDVGYDRAPCIFFWNFTVNEKSLNQIRNRSTRNL